MEKDPNLMGCDSGMSSSSPMPTAPPSYNEAVTGASGSAVHPYPSLNNAPYPMVGNAMPTPQNYDHSKPGEPNYGQMPREQMANYGAPANMPQQQYPQPYAAPSNQVTVIQSNFVCAVGPKSVRTRCPSCRADIETTTSKSCQSSAHLCCLLLFICGCFLCSCIPYCMDSYKIVQHTCPNCKTFIGVWRG